MPTLDDPCTPFAVVDRARMDRNIARLHARLDAAGVPLRLHVKTSKSLDGRVLPDLLMTGASQEHGTLALRPGSTHALPDLPVGTRVRILPNHACATAAQHREYHVIDGGTAIRAPVIVATWDRHHGW